MEILLKPISLIYAEGMLENHIPKNAVVPFEPFQAMVEPIDYGKRVDTGKITPAQWLADFKNAKVTYYYNKNDTPPYFAMMKNWDRLK